MENGIECNSLVFFVNGKKIVEIEAKPEWTLIYYLRNKLRLCGTKLGCGEGGCGSCTVMVSKYDRKNKKILHFPINACLAPLCSIHGLAVTTVEGIGSTKSKLHPVQERIAKAHGSQCGFCTPGIVMSMYTLLRNSSKPNMKEIEIAFQGNLCRCTGYRPIIEGYKTFTEQWELAQNSNKLNNGCLMGSECCKLQKLKDSEEVLYKTNEFTPYDPSQEPIFPPELKLNDSYDFEFLRFKSKTVTWYRPVNLSQLLRLKQEFPEGKIVVGNTEVGLEIKFKNSVYPVIIQANQIPELLELTETEKGIRIGASTTLEDLERFLKVQIEKHSETKTRIFKTIVEMLHVFAGKQIRSVASIGGNIMTGSPISDLIPILLANEVNLQLKSTKNYRNIKLDENFTIGYRKHIVNPEEVLIAINIPFTNPDRYSYASKQSRRREDDIAIVNSAINVQFQPGSNIIKDINVAFGGMSFKTVTAMKTRQKLKGKKWNRSILEEAYKYLSEDLPLDAAAPGGMILYRKSLTLGLFLKFFLSISQDLQKYVKGIDLDSKELSIIDKNIHKREYKSSQYFTVVPETRDKSDPLQRPLIHSSAYKQASGEAIYCDDMPFVENEAYFAFVLSTKAHAKIIKIDPSEALKLDGVIDFVSSKDVEGDRNIIGPIVKDEKIFFNDIVTSQGQVIAGIVAKDQATAQKAAKIVKVQYEEIQPAILSISDAIKHKSFLGNVPSFVMKEGDVEEALEKSPHVLEGEVYIGGQEHFYMETIAALIVPKYESDEIEVYSCTQSPSELAIAVAKALGIHQNRVVCKVKRLGGAFGGKEYKPITVALPMVIAAKKLNRPIRCSLDRSDDILMTGGRHPFLIKYKVGFQDCGKIQGAKVSMFSNCGYSMDLSYDVMEHAMSVFENAYKIPTCHVEGFLCKTNLISNTAFRGFGAPQAMLGAEIMLEHISEYLNIDILALKHLNMYKEGDSTFYNQKLIDCTLDKCWNECLEMSNFQEKRKEIVEFNKMNKYRKRGIGIVPIKYGVWFTNPFLNQGAALVSIYTDGSVLLNHGGVEMGQGLFIKMLQIASKVLEIPVEKIHTVDTSTDKIPNITATAASSGSDLFGAAILEACNILKQRLEPFKEKNPKGKWEDWVKAAYLNRVSLSSTGFYRTPNEGYNWETRVGDYYNYFTYGAGCAEVEIDTLTGDHRVKKVDIVMDLGESLNPAIDIGQIEGAFMQGYGLYTLEEMVYLQDGSTFTKGPSTYKIPGFGDIPEEFNVSVLKGSSNPRAVYSSKAVGEPPLFSGSAVFFAIKDAIKAARKENGIKGFFRMDSPATAERIRMACQDNITEKIHQVDVKMCGKSWNVELQ